MIGESPIKKHKSFNTLYVAIFVLSVHLYLTVYMNSSFLSGFIKESFVGSVYMIGSALSVFTLLYVSRLLRAFGNYRLLCVLAILEFLAFLGLSYFSSAAFIIPLFILHGVMFPLILFSFDVFLEGYTEEESETGRVRGTFLTIVNLALILAPLVAGIILDDSGFKALYLISALFLLPFMFLIRSFKDFEDPKYHDIDVKNTLACISGRKELYSVFISQFLMRFFFSWMVIYMPIYLHSHLGFSWEEVGLMTAIILIPFALIEYPAGKIADTYLGERELLATGFLLAGSFTMFFSFAPVVDFVFLTAILFVTRMGASLIEIMSESYFFKHVDATDNNTISFFRITRPFAYILGPLVGTITLFFLDIQHIWAVLGALMLLGTFSVKHIENTHHESA